MTDEDKGSIEAHMSGWNDVYATRAWGRYPPEDLVRFMARKFSHLDRPGDTRVLEVGCGAGANIWFLAREGYQVAGIDGSEKAVDLARKRLEEECVPGIAERADLRQGNFATLPWTHETFDAVVDIEAIYANTMATIRATITEVHRVLKPRGYFFGKMFSTQTSGHQTGEEIELNTSLNPTVGGCAGFGLSHFFTEGELRELFSEFSAFDLDWTSRSDRGQTETVFEWLVTAQK